MQLNVYKVDFHLKVENADGDEVVRPGSSTSQLVAAESLEAAISGAAKDNGEEFEVEHVSNVLQGVLIVLPARKAAKPAAPAAPVDQKPATETVQ